MGEESSELFFRRLGAVHHLSPVVEPGFAMHGNRFCAAVIAHRHRGIHVVPEAVGPFTTATGGGTWMGSTKIAWAIDFVGFQLTNKLTAPTRAIGGIVRCRRRPKGV